MNGRHPIDSYSSALNSLRDGDRDKAAEDLSHALGSNKVTQPIRSGIDQFLAEGTYAHEAALTLLEARLRRRQNGK